MKTDVIVIGAGLAGMMAAYAAQEEGAEVILIDRGSVGIGTNSAMANGVFACPTSDYGPEVYVRDTIQVGRRINNADYVKLIAQEAPRTVDFLRALGLNLKEGRGRYVVRRPRPEDIPGLILIKTLAEKIMGLEKVTLIRGFYVTEILKREGISVGVKGFDQSGQELVFIAPAVILACGGAGAIYLRNDNQRSTMGQGYALSAKAGLSLWDMEFVQFYPLVLNEPRLPSMIVYPPYPKEIRLINSSGEDLIKKWQILHLNEAIATKRDEMSVLLYEEEQRGPIYLDCRYIPEASFEYQRLSLFKKIRFDFQNNPIAVSPAAHFFMGGVRTDNQGQTKIPGLFACGEIVWGLHGANRLGGNALTECAVMGNIAGRNAALYAQADPLAASPIQGQSKAWTPGASPCLDRLRELRQKVREAAWNYAGILRPETGSQQGLKAVQGLHSQLDDICPQSIEERRLKDDLLSAALVIKAILTASLARQETRGSFIRRDFPREDNLNWLKNSCLTYDSAQGRFSLSHEDVPTYPMAQ